MALFRKLSKSFRKSKGVKANSTDSVNGTLTTVEESKATSAVNGDHGNINNTTQNGSSVSQSLEKTKDVQHPSTYKPYKPETPPSPLGPETEDGDHSPLATRKDVEDAFTQFAQLIHAREKKRVMVGIDFL